MLKVIELFGGIGAPRKALDRLGIDFDVIDYVDIDKYAVKSYNAIFNENYEPQDITKWDKQLEVDLIFHGSPCQDFSLAGKQAGADIGSGTRSSLMYETIRIVGKLRPRYVIWENVKNVVSKKHRHNFDNYLNTMQTLGYTNYWQILNAKDYGIPQNRERVFTISILNNEKYNFPQKQELKLRLKDMLEDEVDEKYYLSNEKIEKIAKWKAYQQPFEKVLGSNSIIPTLTARGAGEEHSGMITYSDNLIDTTNLQKIISEHRYDEGLRFFKDNICGSIRTIESGGAKLVIEPNCLNSKGGRNGIDGLQPSVQDRVYDSTSISPAVTTSFMPSIAVREATKKGYAEAIEVDSINLEQPSSNTRRGRVGHQVAQTLNTGSHQATIQNYRIRKLTPKECWRLMGFDDSDFDKASKTNSNAQLYKQSGNSIVVNVLEAIFKNLLGG